MLHRRRKSVNGEVPSWRSTVDAGSGALEQMVLAEGIATLAEVRRKEFGVPTRSSNKELRA